jgi:glucose/mannose transport system permease protein
MQAVAAKRSRSPNPITQIRRIQPDRVYAFLTILPSIILLGIFVYGFIGQTFLWSLTDWTGMEAHPHRNYIGLDNYTALFGDATTLRFRQELVNTFFFTLFFLTGCLILGFVLAVLLDQHVRGEGIFRTIFLFPMALSFAITGTIWRWLLDPKGGINRLPTALGADAWKFRWLNNRQAYTFNWHEVPLTTTGLILLIFALILFLRIRGRKYLAAIYLGVPMTLFVLWMWSDWLTFNGADKTQMHGMFNWANVPRYVVAAILVGLLVFWVSQLWHGKRRAAVMVSIPTVLVFIWYVANGPERFPNVDYPEAYGFNVALIGLIIPAMWQMSGYTMAMYLAGIRGIPEELREAARVDGCNEWQVYTRIVLPMLRPITLSAAIVLGHISLKVFDLIFAMVGIDYLPVSVPGVQVYYTMFRSNRFAVGSAIAMVLLVMVASVIIPYLITSLRSEHEL